MKIRMPEFGLGVFNFKYRRPDAIYLKPGQTVIVFFWKWWPPGWRTKQYSMDKNGHTKVSNL